VADLAALAQSASPLATGAESAIGRVVPDSLITLCDECSQSIRARQYRPSRRYGTLAVVSARASRPGVIADEVSCADVHSQCYPAAITAEVKENQLTSGAHSLQ
jgi:hypothetical protein